MHIKDPYIDYRQIIVKITIVNICLLSVRFLFFVIYLLAFAESMITLPHNDWCSLPHNNIEHNDDFVREKINLHGARIPVKYTWIQITLFKITSSSSSSSSSSSFPLAFPIT